MRKKLLLGLVLAMSLTFAGCLSTDDAPENNVTDEQAESSETAEESGSDIFEFELSTQNMNKDGVNADYPVFVNTNSQEMADSLNELVLNDLNDLVNGMTAEASDAGEINISISCEYSEKNSQIVSICYLGEYSGTDLAYPVSFYHSLTLNAQNGEEVYLSDLFTIDENFVNSFLGGMYTVYRDDLNLEESGVVVSEAITTSYDSTDLIDLFSSQDAFYYLNQDYIMLSVPVQNALGDHIEMSLPLERLEGNSIRDHVYWQDYGFLDGNANASEDTSEPGTGADVSMAYYENATYGYSQIYPEMFNIMVESDDGAGVTMTSDSSGFLLLIWAEYNINNLDGFSLMESAKGGYETITNYSGDDDSYRVDFQEGSNEDSRAGVESGYIDGDKIIHYQLSYPIDSDAPFADIIEMMENGRTY